MSEGTLRLRFIADDDGTGRLVARAEANGFAGEGGAYFDAEKLKDFAVSLGAFPLVGRPSIAGGVFSREARGELEQEHLLIACYPVDAQGHIGVHVRLATELWASARPESLHAVSLQITTNYEALRRFSNAVAALVNGRIEEAVLDGEG